MENENLFIDLSGQEMLDLWKTVLRLREVRRECTIERDDGIDIDELLQVQIGQWYAHLLLTAPVEHVPVEDMKAEVTLSTDGQGLVTATLPERAVRPVEWRLAEWKRSVSRFLEPSDPESQLQHSPYTRGGCWNPVAVRLSPGRLLLVSAPSLDPELQLALCVARPAEGRYLLHRAALSTIPQWGQSHPVLL